MSLRFARMRACFSLYSSSIRLGPSNRLARPIQTPSLPPLVGVGDGEGEGESPAPHETPQAEPNAPPHASATYGPQGSPEVPAPLMAWPLMYRVFALTSPATVKVRLSVLALIAVTEALSGAV